ALREARASDHRTRETVNRFFTVVSEDTLLNQPHMHPLRKELLGLALAYYQEFLQTHADDADLRAEVAASHYRVGRITKALESPEAALPSCEAAEQIQRALLHDRPHALDLQRDLGTTL